MESAKHIHKDHIGAIIDLDYSPTGREFVTGSFDKTVRIFPMIKVEVMMSIMLSECRLLIVLFYC